MSYPFEEAGGDWNSNTFPYNLSTFTASSNLHPDLPSEPPGYDEFEFSFPSELSPSLFSLPFNTETTSRGILSPTGSSFPALSTASQSPAAWADQYLAKSPQTAVAGPSNTSLQQGHVRQESTVATRKLFEDDERSALNAFFEKTLDDAAKPVLETGDIARARTRGVSEEHDQPSTSANGTPAQATDEETVGGSAESSSKPETRKRTRKPTAPKKAAVPRASKATARKPPKVDSTPLTTAKTEEEDEDADGDHDDGQSPAKRGRTDSVTAPLPASLDRAAVPAAPTGTGKRSSHIASEQKRRSTIKDNYKSLVDLLLAGEATSAISLLGGEEEDFESGGGITGKKAKPKGRGRGRKGQDGAGATKSVVLERAADYLRWLDQGNDELEREIGRLESILAQ